MAKTIERSLLNLYSEHLKEKLANLQVMKLPKNLKKCKNISKMHHSKIQILFQTVICSNLSRINVNGWLNEVNWDKILMIKHWIEWSNSLNHWIHKIVASSRKTKSKKFWLRLDFVKTEKIWMNRFQFWIRMLIISLILRLSCSFLNRHLQSGTRIKIRFQTFCLKRMYLENKLRRKEIHLIQLWNYHNSNLPMIVE